MVLCGDKRGVTVPEMVVATSILAGFLVLALGAIVPAFKISKQAEESLASQREVVLAFDRLTAEMSTLNRAFVTTAPGAVSFVSDDPYIGANSALDASHWDDLLTTTPDTSWQKTIILRHRDGDVWRQEYPYTFGTAVMRLIAADLPLLADNTTVAQKIFAKNVEAFEIETAGRSRVRFQVRSVHREGQRPTACQLTVQIQMRGGI